MGLAWAAILGFVRIATHRQILDNPLPVGVACETARAWLRQPYVSVLHPGDRHAEIVGLLERWHARPRARTARPLDGQGLRPFRRSALDESARLTFEAGFCGRRTGV